MPTDHEIRYLRTLACRAGDQLLEGTCSIALGEVSWATPDAIERARERCAWAIESGEFRVDGCRS